MRIQTLLAVVPLALALTACGTTAKNDGVASANGGTTAPSGSAKPTDRRAAALKFAQCMRENGIDMKDPGPDGGFTYNTSAEQQETAKKAEAKCRPLLKDAFADAGTQKVDPEYLDKLTKFAQCMRENGIDMKDPGPDGSVQWQFPTGTPEEKINKIKDICVKFAPEGFSL
ncbi:hypothetical protein [Rhizohabitans arisaemae]|uniref:hypothetical protein n=1 Tax=Rhizohabitans arisaemae TaxID=2720610 RepID=UPI0024B15287|nr:hypothetical protein [Rhizohabitans arisaemae]